MQRRESIVMMLVLAVSLFLLHSSQPAVGQRVRRAAGPMLRVQLRPDVAYRAYLQKQNVPADAMAKDMASFNKLPEELKQLIVTEGVKEPKQATAVMRPVERDLGPLRIDPKVVTPALLLPNITGFAPSDGSPGQYELVFGSNFNDTSVVYFNGNPAQTFQWTLMGQSHPTMFGFQVPSAGVNYGSNYPVQVKNGALAGNTEQFPVVAPRGQYRGHHGWKFANKGGPTIPWSVFRNYFGASNVEFADGTHKPAAESWYDTRYKGVGGGGNCYGMTLLSLRFARSDLGGLLHQAWWQNNLLPRAWDYNSNRNNDQAWESVMEMQGSQVAEPQHTLLWDRINNQSANDAWTMAKSIIPQDHPNGCVMALVGNGGHAVVAYNVGPDQAQRQFIMYDNNNPYDTTETDGPDASIATTNKAANTFSYGGYSKVGIYSLTEVMVAPSLPAEAIGGGMGLASESSYLSVSKPARVVQITDEDGNTFYAGNQENTGPNRLADAAYTVPLMGGPVPDSYPHTWIFMRSDGKNYTVNIQAPAGTETQVNFVQKGLVTNLRAEGQTFSLMAEEVNSNGARLVIPDPAAARINRMRLIAIPGPDEQRTFQLLQFDQNLQGALTIGLNADRTALQLENRAGQAFNCRARLAVDRANDHTTTGPLPLTVEGSQTGILRPDAWRNLPQQGLRLEIRSLAGQQLDVRQIRPR